MEAGKKLLHPYTKMRVKGLNNELFTRIFLTHIRVLSRQRYCKRINPCSSFPQGI